jgi:hypothetical protein
MRECRWAFGITQGTIAANTTDGRHPDKHCRGQALKAEVRGVAIFDLERVGQYPVRGFKRPDRAVCVSRLNADLSPVPGRPQGARTRTGSPGPAGLAHSPRG